MSVARFSLKPFLGKRQFQPIFKRDVQSRVGRNERRRRRYAKAERRAMGAKFCLLTSC